MVWYSHECVCVCLIVRFESDMVGVCSVFFFFLMIRRPPRSTLSSSSAASDVYKRQVSTQSTGFSIDHHLKAPIFATAGTTVELWDVNRTKPIQTFEWGDDTIRHCRFNKVETDLLACCMADRGMTIFDTRTRSGHSKIILEMTCNSVCWSPFDPNTFVAGCDDWNCYLFDMRVPGKPKSVFQGHVSAVTSVDFSPTGTHFCAGSMDLSLIHISEPTRLLSISYAVFCLKKKKKKIKRISKS
eukprot:TRINITY_DN1414_c0_g1_i2.p1 TRINITY_DN1414_c0_g1~~TRINITY_DN1414_c0_g1_i2.p1  ORF type:complete len:242 (+),score=65.63 TRINITY_DN1414_c0_g1_i2:43-768(+)